MYGYFCDLIQANNPIVLGPANSNLPRIVLIIAQVFAQKTIESTSEVGQRLLGIVKQVESNADVFQMCASQLTPDLQMALQEAFREVSANPTQG